MSDPPRKSKVTVKPGSDPPATTRVILQYETINEPPRELRWVESAINDDESPICPGELRESYIDACGKPTDGPGITGLIEHVAVWRAIADITRELRAAKHGITQVDGRLDRRLDRIEAKLDAHIAWVKANGGGNPVYR